MSPRRKSLILAVLALGAAILLCMFFWGQLFISTKIAPDGPTVVDIKPGSSFSRIAAQLEDAGIISDARSFTLLAEWRNATGQVHAGEYLFEQATNPDEVLTRLTTGDIMKFRVTIPEGFTLTEIASRLAKTGVGSEEEFLVLCYNSAFINNLGIKGTSLEGYLYPETYTYTSTTTVREMLHAMVNQLNKNLTPGLLTSAKAVGLDRHNLLTLASIIQKEAGNTMEMPLISAVFHNRLNRGIALQADPTVIYGIKNFDGNLTRKHLDTPTPYNTYRRRGLPPGPIASPGQLALHAAAHPADSKALYFVAKGDGTHEFNNTLKEHNRAVRRYQLKR